MVKLAESASDKVAFEEYSEKSGSVEEKFFPPIINRLDKKGSNNGHKDSCIQMHGSGQGLFQR